MNILLTTRREPAECRNPIAILDLAAYLRNFGHTVDCYYLDQIQTGRHTNRNRYDLVGLSVLQVVDEKQPFRDAMYLRRRFCSEVVVGGKWTRSITENQKRYLKNHGFNLHLGPGEHYFVDREIDYATYPSWHRVDFHTLNDVRSDIMSTRGCPYHCHFCHNTEKKVSFFSPKRTVDNIELLFNLGVSRISFCDDIFTLNLAHMEAVYNELKGRAIPIENRTEFFAHINHINQGMIGWIRKYRPFQVNVGVESGDDRMLKLMGKGFDSETAYGKLKMLHEETGVPIGTLFLIGFPGETEESLQNTLNFLKRIRTFAGNWVSYYQPIPGTKGYDMAVERNRHTKAGRRNMHISYVDPNLTRKTLFIYNYRMMDYSPSDNLRRKVIYMLIEILPCWLLERLRIIRQRIRLRKYTDSYLNAAEAN